MGGNLSYFNRDYSIFEKMGFERSPIGIKFQFNEPQGITKLEKQLPLCGVFVEAQKSRPFFYTKENEQCSGGFPLGMIDVGPRYRAGLHGADEIGIYKEPRANRRIYHELPRLQDGTCNYVLFSRLQEIAYDPDIIIFTCNVTQAELLLRAYAYTTGKMWQAKGYLVLSCAWLYVYPFISGELNMTITGLGFGMRDKKILPPGLILITLPYDLVPMIIENLADMKWDIKGPG
jgi:uncharacterized protein (DUF169 family)